jgi:3-hydroxyacyl-[acyl-carrier-protein] dehydratase
LSLKDTFHTDDFATDHWPLTTDKSMRWFWIDRFTEFVPRSHAAALKGITLCDNFMHDHWDAYPIMPNTLIAEGMAQTGGLLVSELYQFKELVVLAKFSNLSFHGEARAGDQLIYRARIDHIRDVGSMVSVSATNAGRLQAEAEIFFARMQTDTENQAADAVIPPRLFDPEDLSHWLHMTGVFDIGVHEDGRRMRAADYGLPLELATK